MRARRLAGVTEPLASLLALTDRCVQCGLCLPACPTYRLDGLEAESPRGRIAMARAWELGTIEPTPIGDAHLDQCLEIGRASGRARVCVRVDLVGRRNLKKKIKKQAQHK